MRALHATAMLLLLTGCGVLPQTPSPIPFGGPRAPVLAHDVAFIRGQVGFPLREPTWLPDGFAMWNMDATGPTAVDQFYRGPGDAYVHIWQTSQTVPSVPATDVVDAGDWTAFGLEQGGIELRGRIDGVTISVDGSVGEAALRRVVASLRISAMPSGEPQPTR